MPVKDSSGFSLKLTGPGISFDRPVTEEVANRIINLVMMGVVIAPSAAPASNVATLRPSGSPFAQSPGDLTGVTIKQFIAQKRPENSYQRVACLAYYLTHASATPHFKTKDISQANTDAAVSRLSNAAASVNDATSKYGYLSSAGSGAKQITAFGEQVVEALPDREKVKQLNADNKSRARKKSKKKSK